MKKLRAAIIGLGKIGIDFDRIENRSSIDDIWTHYSAYKNLSENFDLVFAVENSKDKAEAVKQYDSKLEIVSSISELKGKNLDVISICTPDQQHFINLQECLLICRGIFIEKPLFIGVTQKDILNLTNLIKSNNSVVYVNYYKRYEPSVEKLLNVLKGQRIHTITCKYSGPLAAVGSHAIDLINFICPIQKLISTTITEERVSAAFLCKNEVHGFILQTGDRYQLIFELEVITDTHRFILSKNLSRFTSEEFLSSNRYKNYFELGNLVSCDYTKNPNRLVSCLRDIYKDINNNRRDYSNYELSVSSQIWLEQINNLIN